MSFFLQILIELGGEDGEFHQFRQPLKYINLPSAWHRGVGTYRRLILPGYNFYFKGLDFL